MKKIIEILRGNSVPDNAKWLKDISRVKYGEMPVCDCHYIKCTCEQEQKWTTYDIFEVQIEEEKPLKELKFKEAGAGSGGGSGRRTEKDYIMQTGGGEWWRLLCV